MTPSSDNSSSDDLSEYLQAYLDETEEELETLVQSLLTLEDNPRDTDALNESFRMMHSLKGSSGLMGFEGIAELAHQLENRFDQFRAGEAEINRPTMNVMLDCLDFFRTFVTQLRAGEETNEDASELIRRLELLEREAVAATDDQATTAAAAAQPGHITLGGGFCVRVTFRKGLQLADLKARLIVARLSNIGQIIGSEPSLDEVRSTDDLPQFVVIVATDSSPAEVRTIASVDGVESVEIQSPGSRRPIEDSAEIPPAEETATVSESASDSERAPAGTTPADTAAAAARPVKSPSDSETPAAVTADSEESRLADSAVEFPEHEAVAGPSSDGALPAADVPSSAVESSRQRVAETVRVEIDRLDRLMNLTGELVVTNARFHQLAGQMSPALRSARNAARMSEVGGRLREGVESLRRLSHGRGDDNSWESVLSNLEEDLAILQDESTLWQEGRRCFSRLAETIDQLSRVSQNLQQGVLDTRMMPVGPLFARFKRVIRDLSQERHKKVQLLIRGEKTELDKRMIDELGDPLLHLIRNSIDHGLESPEERRRVGKSESGTIVLEASHSGNNVFVSVHDDGSGIDIEKVRQKIVDRGLLDADSAALLGSQQVIDHIWHPGFSTAERVTEISGRGVGMDIVRSRISELNGSIEVSTDPGEGTRFLLRLPLTLAIIRSLLVRFRETFFSIPIDDVREIVAIPADQIYSVHGQRTIEVRGEFIPLSSMDRVFQWHSIDSPPANSRGDVEHRSLTSVEHVVILQSRGKLLGLCVDELLGGSDVVIKSLADNFVSIQGLSGASIMGDGTVCLMLDTTAIIEMMSSRVPEHGER